MKGKVAVLATLALAAAPAAAYGHGKGDKDRGHGSLRQIDRFVVIYEENHSFDNLYGMWEGVDGIGNADEAHSRQVNQAGQPYECLQQNDVNLASPTPLPATCTNTSPAFTSAFENEPFTIDKYIAPTDKTCPAPGVFAANGVLKDSPGALPGGCTRDLVHRFYQEQYQLNGGRQNRYTTGSDAVGLTQGVYDTKQLPIYNYLHGPGAPRYAIADRFFQGAFGGSFLNHQWLIAAASPTFPGATADQHSLLDANGMPISYPLYAATGTVRDTAITQACPAPNNLLCGDFAVNTIQPPYQPFSSPTALKLPPQTHATIGDRLSRRGISWAWYSGGWSNADGDVNAPGWTNGSGPSCSDPNAASTAVFPNCPDKLFQFHHQPFNYFASFAPGTAERRRHLRDEEEFIARAQGSRRHCRLPAVSFVKPVGEENEHPGYASEHSGSSHLVELLQTLEGSPCARDTMIVVTYDEFGGQWDHVPPPGQGMTTPGPHDAHGPSTRIPALILAPGLKREFTVDDTSHDTTSILSTIEHRFGLQPLTSRDKAVADLSSVFGAKHRGRGRRH